MPLAEQAAISPAGIHLSVCANPDAFPERDDIALLYDSAAGTPQSAVTGGRNNPGNA